MNIQIVLALVFSTLALGVLFLLLLGYLSRPKPRVSEMRGNQHGDVRRGSDEREDKKKAIYTALLQGYFENTFFGMVRRIDNSLTELLRFCLTILTAEAVITALINVSGEMNATVIVLFLLSCCAFLLSALILLWAITQRATIEVDWFQDTSIIARNCKEHMENLYETKRKKQTVSVLILFMGVGLLLASIIYTFASVGF